MFNFLGPLIASAVIIGGAMLPFVAAAAFIHNTRTVRREKRAFKDPNKFIYDPVNRDKCPK